MSISKFLYTHPIFRLDEFKAWKNKQGLIKESSLHSSVKYCVETQKIKRLRRELFGSIPPNETSKTAQFDPYLIAAKVAKDSVLAYHTALELHGVSYSSFGLFTFLTSSKIKPFEIDTNWFQPVLMPKALKKRKLDNLYVQEVNRQGLEIKITNVSRTYVDVIDRPDLSGGWEEVSRSINNIAVLNYEEILEYCKIRDNSTLNAKVGCFLEQRIGAFEPPKKIIQWLLELTPKSAQYIGNKDKEQHKLIKKWNLMVPVSVINQSWVEPDYDV